MNFKTKKEKFAALRALPDEPNGPVDDLEVWQKENAQKRKEIEDAVVEEATAAAPQEPAKEPPAPKEPKVEDVFSFNLKREELPEELRGYKNPDEIIKQFGHARSYANKAQSQLEALAAEKEALAAERAALAKQNEEAQKELQQIREQLKKPQQGTIDELEGSLKEFEGMEGTRRCRWTGRRSSST